MMPKFETDQENFWAGQFGEEYIDRNSLKKLLSTNIWFFTRALRDTTGVSSVIEFGSNIGNNLVALHTLLPELNSSAIEINETAIQKLKSVLTETTTYNESILTVDLKEKFDLVLIKGVLIHQNPKKLNQIYNKLYEATNKYILIAEYYNPSPVSLEYRGEKDKLFKRDFAGEMLDIFSDLKLVDYGFFYRNDKKSPQDDITWFLLSKN